MTVVRSGRIPALAATDLGLLVARLGFAGLLFGFHGWTRLHRAAGYAFFGQPWTFVTVVGRLGFPFPSVFAVLSALSESVGALLMAVGLTTRAASLIVAFNMAVAVFNEASKGDPYELPALYLVAAASIAIAGPGRASLDGLLLRRRARSTAIAENPGGGQDK